MKEHRRMRDWTRVMFHLRSIVILSIAVSVPAWCDPRSATAEEPKTASIDPHAFQTDFRIEYYLDTAMELQKLDAPKREERLRAIARDPKRASEVYPLCRMLFEAKPNGKFRGPALGKPYYVAGDHANWPLIPITIIDKVPILIVHGYLLLGSPEPAYAYVDYCFEECNWRDTKYESVTIEKRREIVEKFIASDPKLKDKNITEFLRRQVE